MIYLFIGNGVKSSEDIPGYYVEVHPGYVKLLGSQLLCLIESTGISIGNI